MSTDRYMEFRRDLALLRARSAGEDSDLEEDRLLGEMDDLWWRLSRTDQALIRERITRERAAQPPAYQLGEFRFIIRGSDLTLGADLIAFLEPGSESVNLADKITLKATPPPRRVTAEPMPLAGPPTARTSQGRRETRQ